jgi:hypothetical protein
LSAVQFPAFAIKKRERERERERARERERELLSVLKPEHDFRCRAFMAQTGTT